jgi:hypothetical protein
MVLRNSAFKWCAAAIILGFVGCSEKPTETEKFTPAMTGVVAEWNFNETSGDTAFDVSGNRRHAVFNKIPGREAGLNGNAVVLDGTIWAKVQNDGVFAFNGSFTIEIDFKIPTTTSFGFSRLISCHKGYENTTGYTFGTSPSGKLRFEGYNYSGQIVAESDNYMTKGTFHRAVAKFDAPSGNFTIVFNGDTVCSQTRSFETMGVPPYPFIVGAELSADSVSGAQTIVGSIDRIKIIKE